MREYEYITQYLKKVIDSIAIRNVQCMIKFLILDFIIITILKYYYPWYTDLLYSAYNYINIYGWIRYLYRFTNKIHIFLIYMSVRRFVYQNTYIDVAFMTYVLYFSIQNYYILKGVPKVLYIIFSKMSWKLRLNALVYLNLYILTMVYFMMY